MPPPPPPGIGAGLSFSGISVMRHSVVSSRPAMRRRVLQRGAGDLLRVHDAGLDEVFVFAGGDVVAFVALALLDFLDDDAAFHAGVVGQRAER